MTINWGKTLWAGGKFFIISVIGVAVAALTIAITGYKPSNPAEVIIAQYIVIPVIVGICGLLQNLIKHLQDKA